MGMLVEATGRQVSQMAHIHAQDGHSLTGHPHRCGQERAVAAQRQGHVGCRHIGSGKRWQGYLMLMAQILQVFALHGHVKTSLTQILKQRQHTPNVTLLVGISKDD